jgi:DNA-binding SARP family transcriptional activator
LVGVFLRLFGGLRLEADDRAVAGRAIQKKRLALLALLGAMPAGRVSRDKLIALLWPESDADRARHQLASSVYELRKALGEEAIKSSGDDLLLDLRLVRCDLAEFEHALAAGNPEGAAGWYAGPFLDGFFLSDTPDFERWVDGERNRLAQVYAKALEEIARDRVAGGDLFGAVEWWRRLAAHDPYNGRIALRLVEALDNAGDRAGALQQAQVHTELVRGELGVEPDPEVTAVAARLRAAAADARPSGLSGTAAPEPHAPDVTAPIPGAGSAALASELAAARTQAPIHSRLEWRVSAALALGLLMALSLVTGTGSWYRVLGLVGIHVGDSPASRRQPVVLLMDSPHPSLIYDEEVAQASGTNADVINDLLRDLPVQRIKELAGPYWHRHEEIRQLRPDLILIHLSAFCAEQCEPHRIRMRAFLEYLADTDTRFLIYSRKQPDTLAMELRDMLGDLPRRFPHLAGRIHTFAVRAHGTPHWKDPATAAAFKLQVKELLALK